MLRANQIEILKVEEIKVEKKGIFFYFSTRFRFSLLLEL
jgi:hypothetical protein